MTAEDSVYIPFPGTTLKTISPISTIGTIAPYEKNVAGCSDHCPCRRWVNCSYYNRTKWKKSRTDEDEHMKAIWEYYDSMFRITYDMPIANMNG
jgi:hypothetical protein